MTAPGFSDFRFMLFDQSSNPSKILGRQARCLRQLDPGLQPELRFSTLASNVHVNPRFLARKEEKAKPVRSKDRRAQTKAASSRTELSREVSVECLNVYRSLPRIENRPDFEYGTRTSPSDVPTVISPDTP